MTYLAALITCILSLVILTGFVVIFNIIIRKFRKPAENAYLPLKSSTGDTYNYISHEARLQRLDGMAPEDVTALMGNALGGYMLNREDLSLRRQIGKGSFGDVYVGEWKRTTVAIKRTLLGIDSANIDSFIQEASILSRLRHPNIVQFIGCCVDDNHLYLVVEYCGQGSVQNMVDAKTAMSNELKKKLLMDCCKGMLYLHANKVIHRDLKPGNLLVTNDSQAKVADFGTGTFVGENNQTTLIGTVAVSIRNISKKTHG